MTDANEPTIGILGLLLGCLGLAVTIIGGFVKFLYGRTAQTDEKITALGGELRQAMQTQASDHRLAQANLWTELRRMADTYHMTQTTMADAMTKNQVAIVEAMGKLPTREEMERATRALEQRIMETLRKEVGNR